MRALVVQQLGDPTKTGDNAPLRWVQDHPRPELPATHVRVRVVAAGLNFSDALQVQGSYQEKPQLPFIPGSECSGIVAEVGSDVTAVSEGDVVVAVSQGGCLAEEVCVHAESVYKLPAGVDLERAAGLPVAFGTSYLALVDRARIQPGQTVLVLGAAGGVGVAAVQIAKAVGCRVVAVARGADKAHRLRELGADACIDSEQLLPQGKALHKAVREAAPTGVDVVYDPVGGVAFTEALRCCRWGAHVLVIGFASGTIPKLPTNIALVKNLTVHGIYWGSYITHQPEVLRAGMQQLLQWLQQGKIRVPVSHRLGMSEAASAFLALKLRQVVGKVLLLPQLGGPPIARL